MTRADLVELVARACVRCQNFRKEYEDAYEFPNIWWYDCREHPSHANLKSFPFKNTKCGEYVPTPPESNNAE